MSGPIDFGLTHGGAVARVRLRRPRANVLDSEMVDALRGVVEGCGAISGLKLLVFEGEGPNFSFGASVPAHLPGRVEDMLRRFHNLFFDIEELGVPTAALVRGHCLGGAAELVATCGLVVADASARIGFPEVTLGVFPPVAAMGLRWGVGGATATRLVITGEVIPAGQALSTGLFDLVVDDPEAALDAWYSAHLGALSAVAVRYAWQASRAPFLAALREELPRLESLYLDDMMRHSDPVEGITAFVEKRQPEWRHA